MRVSQANHDLDFDLAEGSHQVAITLLILVQMISEKIINKVSRSIQNLTKLETIDILMTVVNQANRDPDFDLA